MANSNKKVTTNLAATLFIGQKKYSFFIDSSVDKNLFVGSGVAGAVVAVG